MRRSIELFAKSSEMTAVGSRARATRLRWAISNIEHSRVRYASDPRMTRFPPAGPFRRSCRSVMPVEQRERVIAIWLGSTGNGRNPMFNGRRQPSRGGTSRMMREYQVRFCERLGVKFPGPTRQRRRASARPAPRPRCPQHSSKRTAAPCVALCLKEHGGLSRRARPRHSPCAPLTYLSGSGAPSGGITCATLSVIETAV
jgi:hypothetical protein